MFNISAEVSNGGQLFGEDCQVVSLGCAPPEEYIVGFRIEFYGGFAHFSYSAMGSEGVVLFYRLELRTKRYYDACLCSL